MTQRRILYLDNSRLTCLKVAGGTVMPEGSFAPDAEGLAAFADYLAAQRRSVFMLLADVVEEGFQLEDVPHSSGKDRDAIVKRKLAQYYFGTPFSLAHSLGRLKTGRRDERLLLLGLTRPQPLEAWLQVLHAQRVILAGIFSVPQVLEAFLPKEAGPSLLLVTKTPGGLRQTFFAERQLRFSRLTALATGSTEEAAIATTIEAGKMRHYLASQRLIDRNKPLETYLLVHPAQTNAVRARCLSTAELQFTFLDLVQEAGRLGLRTPPQSSQAEWLFCHLLARKIPGEQFAPPAARAYYRLWQTRSLLQAASSVLLAGGLLFAGKQGVELMNLQARSDVVREQIRLDQAHYDETLRSLPKIPLTTDNLRTLVDRYDQVTKRAVGPAPLLTQLSRSLDAYPSISLEHVEWSVSDALVPPATTGNPAAKPAGVSPPAGMASGPYAHASVAARLPVAMAGDERGQLKIVSDFVAHLGAQPDTMVTVLQPPVDTQSGTTLKSSDERRTPEAPRFSFRLTRKL